MKRILVVDDYVPFLHEMTETLSSEDVVVETSASSADAIRRLTSTEFDLVVTDLVLDNRDPQSGFSVLAAAKNRSLAEVIVITAYGRPEYCVESFNLGAFDYVERGSPGSDFRCMLASKIRLALQFQELRRRL